MATKNSVIRTVLFGMGKMGRNHFRVIQDNPLFQLIAVIDPQLEVAPDKTKLLRSINELSPDEWDAAVIAVPSEIHHQVALELIPFKKPILMEKPIAATPEQGQEILKLLKLHGTKMSVGHVERFNPAVLKLKELLQTEWMGQPIHFSFTRVGGYPNANHTQNNVLLDLAVHDLDVLRFLIGPIDIISSVCHSNWQIGVWDTSEILVKSPNGISGSLHCNWITPTKIRSLRVTGTQGVCFLDYILQTITLMGGNLLKKQSSTDFDFDRLIAEYQATDKVDFGIIKEEPLKAQLKAFAKFVRNEPSNVCTAEEGYAAMSLAHRAIQSAEIGFQKNK